MSEDPTNPTPNLAASPLAASRRAVSALVHIRAAHDRIWAELVRAHGRPLTASMAACGHAVIAVGGLASGELSVGAPLGLLFLYETDEGHSPGARGLSPRLPLHAFFERFFQALSRAIEQAGLRLDLGVRPEGKKGPLCNSLDAFVDYLERFGGPDERRALARLSFVAGEPAFGRRIADELGPFVFRRSLDAALVASLTVTPTERLNVAALVDTMAAGLGGRHTMLKTGSTRERLAVLARLRLLDAGDAERLATRHEAELEGETVTGEESLAAIVHGLATLTTARAPLTGAIAQALDPAAPEEARRVALEALGFRAPDLARQRLDALSRHPDGPFHWRNAGREGSLAAALVEHASVSGDPDQVLLACEALTHLLKHQPHVGQQLANDPARLSRLSRLFASDPVAGRRLLASPSLVSSLVVEGQGADASDLDTGALWSAPPGERARVARELLDEARVLSAWAGRETPDEAVLGLELEVVTALFCELAEVDGPDEAPVVLLARRGPESEGARSVELGVMLPDDAGPELRALPRRLVAVLGEGREGPLVKVVPDARRRPFTVSELARHRAEGGQGPRGWRVLAGPPHLVLHLELAETPKKAAPTAVMAGSGPA